MGLEGAVRLGLRAQLDVIADPAERVALVKAGVDHLSLQGKALNVARYSIVTSAEVFC